MTFKVKLAIFATVLVAIVAGVLSYLILWGQTQAIRESLSQNRNDTVIALRQVAREAILVDDDTDMVNYVNLLERDLPTAYAMVLYPDGKVRVHTDAMLIGEHLKDEATQRALKHRARQNPLIQNLEDDKGETILDYSIPIMLGLNPAEFKGIARIGFRKNALDKILNESLREARSQVLFAFIISLFFGIIGATVLAWFMTRPIGKIIDGARIIGRGKLDHQIQVQSKDELKTLADEFNVMAIRLKELDQMKQDFVSNVTHELRSPMTSIRGYLDFLLKGDAGKLTAQQHDYISVVKNNAVRLGRFIDNLLDVAKIEAHKLKLTPEACDLAEIAHEMEVLFKPQLQEKKLKFINAVPATKGKAFVDKDKVAEVLINLLSNAIKFTPEGGQVTLAAVESSNHFEVQIEDTGPGIPADMIGKLFNKFEQVKSSQGMARKQKGTGLGLAIVKGIIEAHGGKIWIESPARSGVGSVFRFTLPKLTSELKDKFGIKN